MVSLLWFPANAEAPPISLADYWAKVEQTRAVVAGEPTPAQLAALADEWTAISRVALPDGKTLPVDHTFLAAQLRAKSPNLARLEQLLSRLLALRDGWTHSPHAAADVAALQAILARPEFQWPEERPSFLALLWQKALDFIWTRLAPLLPDEVLIPLGGNWSHYLLTVLGSLLLVVVLFFMMRQLLGELAAESEIKQDPATGQEILTADLALKRARNLSKGGDYRSAVRYLYLSALLGLDERDLLRYDRSQTNREYLRSVAHLPQLAAILRDVIDVFDRVWYGYHALDEATYHRYAARVAELRRQR